VLPVFPQDNAIKRVATGRKAEEDSLKGNSLTRHDSITPLGASLLLASLAASLLFWRASRSVTPQDALLRIRRTGVVRIGYANEAPYGYLDTETGEITGEAPEIAKVILRRLGARRIDAVMTEFGSLIPGLKANRFDLIAAGMYINRSAAVKSTSPFLVMQSAKRSSSQRTTPWICIALATLPSMAPHDSASWVAAWSTAMRNASACRKSESSCFQNMSARLPASAREELTR
jgi:hypothetical protein